MKTEISNELILQAHKEACPKWKAIIEKECPSLFPKFKVGQYARITYQGRKICGELKSGMIGRINAIGDVDCKAIIKEDRFGIYPRESYMVVGDSLFHTSNGPFFELLTPSEISSHLIKLAEEKGFKKKVNVCPINLDKDSNKTGEIIDDIKNCIYEEETDTLVIALDNNHHNSPIYHQGKWATILEEPKVKAVESLFKFADVVKVVDGSSNKDKKTGKKRDGVDPLFRNYAVVIETNLNIPTHEKFDGVSYWKDSKEQEYMYSDLLIRFETGEEVYTSSLMCRLKQPKN